MVLRKLILRATDIQRRSSCGSSKVPAPDQDVGPGHVPDPLHLLIEHEWRPLVVRSSVECERPLRVEDNHRRVRAPSPHRGQAPSSTAPHIEAVLASPLILGTTLQFSFPVDDGNGDAGGRSTAGELAAPRCV